MATINCKNCETNFQGNFCPNCGQSAKIHAINAATFLHDIPHDILHIDKGFPYTFVQMLLRPGLTLKAYLEGKRIKHFRPFAYVVIMSAISSFLIHWNRELITHIYKERGVAIVFREGFFVKYQSAFIFLMIPLVSVFTWLVFRKKTYHFWEHVLINTYMAAQLNLLLILMELFSLVMALIEVNIRAEFLQLPFFIAVFMTYYSFTFSALMMDGYKKKFDWKLFWLLTAMCFFLGTLYATGMITAGVTASWRVK